MNPAAVLLAVVGAALVYFRSGKSQPQASPASTASAVGDETVSTDAGDASFRIVPRPDGTYGVLAREPGQSKYAFVVNDSSEVVTFSTRADAEEFARSYVFAIAEQAALPAVQTPMSEGLSAVPSCFGSMISKDSLGAKPRNLGPEVRALMKPAALAKVGSVKARTTLLSPEGQVAVFKAAVKQLSGSNRSAPGLVTRDVLQEVMPSCEWNIDHDPNAAGSHEAYSKIQQAIWQSAWYLVLAAAAQVGFRVGGPEPMASLMAPANGGKGLLIGRGFLEMPEVSMPGSKLPLGRRVELLVGDYTASQLPRPPFFYAERVYAEVVGTGSEGGPRVKIIDTFNGREVAPRFSYRHGFEVGQVLDLHAKGTTGIRRIFADGSV